MIEFVGIAFSILVSRQQIGVDEIAFSVYTFRVNAFPVFSIDSDVNFFIFMIKSNEELIRNYVVKMFL